MRISVVLAAYNGERHIAEQIDSLLTQSRLPDEIVICDDSPDDRTEKAIPPHPLIRYHRNERQLGVCGNFERCCGLASGDIIFMADQDNVWDKEKIARLAAVLESDLGCDLVFCDSRVVDEQLNDLGYSAWDIQCFDRRLLDRPLFPTLLRRNIAYAHDIAFRRTLLRLAQPFPDLGACHDFWVTLLAAAQDKVRVLPETLTAYRFHGNNVTTLKRPGFRQRFREARTIGRAELARTAQLFAALEQRLKAELVPDENRHLLECALQFHQERARGIRQLFTTHKQFAQGWRSLLRDWLFLRAFGVPINS